MKRIGTRLEWLLATALSLLAIPLATAQTSEPTAGVSRELAVQRAHLISQLRYELALSIPASPAQPVTGRSVMRFRLSDPTRPLVIDFEAEGAGDAGVRVNGRVVPTRVVNGHLVIPTGSLRRGENTIAIAFRAGDGPLNRSADLLYTWFVPANARRAIPCFDQPDLKGRWTLSLEHPAPWQSVANGAERDRRTSGDRVRVRFHPTQALPSYVMSFVVGRMKIETATRAGRVIRLFHREDDAAKLARNRDALFDLHASALAALERYTGIAYPFGKFDVVLIPAFQPGAMEHAGNIAYRAESLLLDESATQEDLLARAQVIAHETAHMWFGNLVTMRWFDDVWTKEVFANFIADKVIEPQFPRVRHDLQFFLAHHGSAYAIDRSAGANPIRQSLDNLSDAGSLYGPIVYDKSPVVMRQLEALLGEKPFREGVRSYLRRHAFGNATWDDLIAALAAHTKRDLSHWSRQWIDEPGRPVIRTEIEIRDGQVQRLVLTQTDPQGKNRSWPQALKVTLSCGGLPRRLLVDLIGRAVDLTRSLDGCLPDYVLAGGEGWGYGEFQLDARSLAYLQSHLPAIEDPLTRAVGWSAMWEALLSARLLPSQWYAMAILSLEKEREAQLISEWLADLRTVWGLFLTPAQRTDIAPGLEALLRHRLASSDDPGMKATWFAALRGMAILPETLAWLRALWQRDTTIPGLPLVEADETALAYALALRDVPGTQALLDTQRDRISNPDRRARFEFVRGAVSADAGERQRWFLALRDIAQRRHETWVVQGLRLLNHPLRAESAASLLPEALDMLREVHRTGALFFDANWASAVLSGHSSPEAALTVARFTDTLPADYPPRLREKLLQSADLLRRAARTIAESKP